MSRLREYLTEKVVSKQSKNVDELCLSCKITYTEFTEMMKTAPPAPKPNPDYEAKRMFLEEERMFPANF